MLVGLTLLSFIADRTLAGIGTQAALTIRITGHQWWWEVRYDDARPEHILTSANEIHVPAGEPIRLVLNSTDVIHSFWVPNLAGKLDLIPGRENVLSFVASAPGTYRGQCAEFCGCQHAHMGIVVVAEPRAASRHGATDNSSPRPRPRAASRWRGATCSWPRLHDVPRDSRHVGRRHDRPRPHASGQPPDARRRDAAR